MAPRLHINAAGFASTMNGLDVLQKSQQSRRWAGAWPTVRVAIGSDADIVVARQQGRALAIAMNFSTTDSAFIATTVSELARALLSHSIRGEIWLHEVHEDERTGVVIVARDPVAHDGWRNGHRAAVPDLKLPDVCRLVDEFDIASDAGRGTTIRATKWCRSRSRVTGG